MTPIPFSSLSMLFASIWDSSWYKLRCCYSSNMLKRWVGGRGMIYFCKVDHFRISENFPGIDLVSIIYVRYCSFDRTAAPFISRGTLYIKTMFISSCAYSLYNPSGLCNENSSYLEATWGSLFLTKSMISLFAGSISWFHLEMMEKNFYFTSKALFVLKIFNIFSWFFLSCSKTAWSERSG